MTTILQEDRSPDPLNSVLVGDVRDRLASLQPESIDCIITSPPYFRLRNYDHDRQLGTETHINDWVAELSGIFNQLKDVLKPTGSLWLNLGDSYSRRSDSGAPAKGMLLGPERLLMALSTDGWIVRNKVTWAKANPMPNSVKDRLSSTHEYVYFLTKSPDYFFDLDAIRTPAEAKGRAAPRGRGQGTNVGKAPACDVVYPPAKAAAPSWAGPRAGNNAGLARMRKDGVATHPLGKNPGDVWRLPTASYHGAHFATFPKSLVERPLLATCPELACERCGKPWQRSSIRSLGQIAVRGRLVADCACIDAGASPGVVLDPFFGAGTVGLVAETQGRKWLGIELHPDSAALALERIEAASKKSSASKRSAKSQRSGRGDS